MKLDLTKLPVGEMLIGFLLVALAVTFVGAFIATDSGGGEEAAPASATPATTSSPGESPSPGGALAVSLKDNKYEPSELTVAAGSTVTINLTNDGAGTHNMHIAGEGNKFGVPFCEPGGAEPCSDPNAVPAGEKATLTWTAPAAPATINFRCDFHITEMTGTITVQ